MWGVTLTASTVFSFFFFFTLVFFHLISGSCAQHVEAIVSHIRSSGLIVFPGLSVGCKPLQARQERVQSAELDGRQLQIAEEPYEEAREGGPTFNRRVPKSRTRLHAIHFKQESLW